MGNKKVVKGLKLGFLMSGLCLGLFAQAETQPAASGTSIVEQPSLKENISIKYLNWLHSGPALTGLFESRQRTAYGDVIEDKTVTMRHYIAPAYKLNADTTLGVTFSLDHSYLGGQDAVFMDPYIRLFNSGLYKVDGLNIAADLRGYIGVSTASRNNKMLTGIRSTQYVNYDIPNSSFTLGINTFAWFYVNGTTAAVSAKDIEVYAGPNVSYKISEKVSANLLYEMDAIHKRDVNYGDWNANGTDLQPNVSWDITPNVNFNPYLNINTGGSLSPDATSLGWLLTVKLM